MLITAEQLKTDSKYRNLSQYTLFKMINNTTIVDYNLGYLSLPGSSSEDKARLLVEWFRENPIDYVINNYSIY